MSPVVKGSFEDFFFVIFALIWGVSSLITRVAKKRLEQTQGGAAPAFRPKAARPNRAPGGDGGEQLRRFLEELTGVKIETQPAAPQAPRPSSPPAVPTWPSGEAAYPASQGSVSRREKKRKQTPGAAVKAVPHARPQPVEEGVASVAVPRPTAGRTLRAGSIRMPAMPGMSMRLGGAGMMSSGGPSQSKRHLTIRQGENLRDAIRWRVLLGPPRALQPYGSAEQGPG